MQGLGLGENAVIDTQSDASTRTASQENSQKVEYQFTFVVARGLIVLFSWAPPE